MKISGEQNSENASDQRATFLRDAARTLRGQYQSGGVTRLEREHRIAERTLPWLVTAHIEGAVVELHMGGETHHARPGDTFCVAPGTRHSIRKLDRRPGYSRWSHTRFSFFNTLDFCSLFDLTPVVRGEVSARIGPINSELAALDTVSADASTRDVAASVPLPQNVLQSALRRRSLLFSLLETLLEVATPNARLEEAARGANRLTRALEHIEANFSQPLARDELARAVHLSPSRFTSLFSAATGLPPGEYIQQRRLREAQQLLLHSDLSIGEIAARCGYADAFHFSRIFKQKNGRSPLHYRQTTPREAL